MLGSNGLPDVGTSLAISTPRTEAVPAKQPHDGGRARRCRHRKRAQLAGLLIAAVVIASLLPSLALAQPLPQPKPLGPGGSCPHGYTSSGSFCVRREGAQDAIPKPPNGTCRAIAPSSSGGGEPAPKSTSFRSIPRRFEQLSLQHG